MTKMVDIWNLVKTKYYSKSDSESSCPHDEISVEGGYKLCLDCGVILQQHFFVDQPNFVSQLRRKRVVCTIYSELPSYIDSDVKNLTVELYKLTTNQRIFRNVLRRSIILACLHRASILLNKPIYFDEMLTIFNLKTHDANKGVCFVSNNIPRDSEFAIPYCNEEIGVSSILTMLGMKSSKPQVLKLFLFVKQESDILNNSHSKSVICGCIWFFLQLKSSTISLKQFAEKCTTAESTIQKKFIMISKIIFRKILKRVFSKLLTFCQPENCPNFDVPKTLKDCDLFDPSENLTVRNFRNCDEISVIANEDGYEYPLDDVDDISEWNLLFEKIYFNSKGHSKILKCRLVETQKLLILTDDRAKYFAENEIWKILN